MMPAIEFPMLGRKNAQLSLAFGVDDIDGTIDDTTKIYSMAGAEEQRNMDHHRHDRADSGMVGLRPDSGMSVRYR